VCSHSEEPDARFQRNRWIPHHRLTFEESSVSVSDLAIMCSARSATSQIGLMNHCLLPY
jgi:hypothetical protein